jgi:4-aminobutyrate aminotransferase-like enzyme
MAPALLNDKPVTGSSFRKPTSILHRTIWRPPVAQTAEGSYVTLENGQKLLDAVGGAAVACIGNGHPKVVQAIKDQVDKVACK